MSARPRSRSAPKSRDEPDLAPVPSINLSAEFTISWFLFFLCVSGIILAIVVYIIADEALRPLVARAVKKYMSSLLQ